MTAGFGSVELAMLGWSIVLGLVQLVLAAIVSVGGRGMPWALGPRDAQGAALSPVAGRLARAFKNFLETFALFAAAVLLITAMNRHTHMSALGAQLYFWARVAYVPAYALAIPMTRTLVWLVSLVGIVLVLSAVCPYF